MSPAQTIQCTGCDGAVGPHRLQFGYAVCRKCWRKTGMKCICEDCGANTRVLPGQSLHLCFKCERNRWFEGKPCARCGRAPERRSRSRVGDDVLCQSCKAAQAPHVECEYCHEIGPERSRNYPLGFTKLACPRCQRGHEFFNTCAGCRRHRLCAGTINGEPYCEMCFVTGSAPIITCGSCGQRKYRFNKDECEDCAWERSHTLLIKRLSAEFRTPWATALFEQYHNDAKLKTMRGHWRKSLKRDVAFFQALETKFDGPEHLSGVLIVRALGNDFVKRYRRAMSFLAYAGLIVMDDDPDYAVERMVDNIKRLTASDTPWIQEVQDRFLTHLLLHRERVPDRTKHSRIPVSAYSLKSAMRAAHQLLTYARDAHAIESFHEMTQNILNQYIGLRRGNRIAVSAFIRYARRHERTFRQLKLPSAQKLSIPAHLIFSEDDRQRYLREFGKETEPGVLHWALICMLNLLYGQQPDKLVKLRMDRVRKSDDGYEIRFAEVWLPLAPIAQPLMAAWMDNRREKGAFEATDSSPFLFPGMRTGTHLTATASKYYRKRIGYDARAGRVTAFAVMIRSGLKQTKVLTQCFGMSAMSATQYLREFGSLHTVSASFVHGRYGQAQQ